MYNVLAGLSLLGFIVSYWASEGGNWVTVLCIPAYVIFTLLAVWKWEGDRKVGVYSDDFHRG